MSNSNITCHPSHDHPHCQVGYVCAEKYGTHQNPKFPDLSSLLFISHFDDAKPITFLNFRMNYYKNRSQNFTCDKSDKKESDEKESNESNNYTVYNINVNE